MEDKLPARSNIQTKTLCPDCVRARATSGRPCLRCQMTLADEAREAEAEATTAMRNAQTGMLRPEMLVPMLGQRLVEKGLLGDADLDHALWTQKKRTAAGESILLGKLLVELGYITRDQLDKAVTAQVMQLRDALQRSNRDLEIRVKERTAQLQDALVKLSEFSQLKADFVANVSHELRTPLTLLGGYLAMVANESLGELNEEQKQALDTASRAGERLGKLIEDLLQFSESTTGSVQLQPGPVSLDIPVNQAMNQVRERAVAREVDLVLLFPQQPPVVLVDCEKINWVICELLTNAVKYTPPGGNVTCRVHAEDGTVSITIADTGIGMPEERVEEAFQPFQQLDGSMTRHVGGTGLGLAMARRILEAHGSHIAVDSQLGLGSTFSFSLQEHTLT